MPIESILVYFAKVIETELGIIYAEHNFFQLQNRLEEIAKQLGIATLQSLYETAQQGIFGPFKQLLMDTATNNETSFFRDAKAFQAMESVILPALFAKAGSPKIRIWSAAISTGQEALSVAMLILEHARKSNRTVDFEILGTDISERALTKARAGVYSQFEVQRGLPLELMDRYFTKESGEKLRANSELLKNITYRNLNLKAPFQFSESFDFVLCRNVLIYQSVQGKNRNFKKGHRATETRRSFDFRVRRKPDRTF